MRLDPDQIADLSYLEEEFFRYRFCRLHRSPFPVAPPEAPQVSLKFHSINMLCFYSICVNIEVIGFEQRELEVWLFAAFVGGLRR